MARLECRVPISPGPSWFNKVRLIVASIREFYPDTIFRVSVGTAEDAEMPPMIPGVEWHYLDRDEFLQWKGTDYPYLATVLDKFKPPFQGDYILSLDADVICLREFDYLFERGGRICGVQAHVPPMPNADWTKLFQWCGVPVPSFDSEYSGWGTMVGDLTQRFGPPYFNSGVVFGPRSVFEELYIPYMSAIRYMRQILASNYWFDQLGLAVGMALLKVCHLPIRYNFPNQQAFDNRYPHELAEIRFLHYLRTDTIDRDRDLMSLEAAQALVARTDLTGSNEAFRRRLDELLPCLI